MRRDHYYLLGIDRNASFKEVRAAYAHLVKQHHPDIVGDSTLMTQRLHDIQESYRCLSDPERRAEHDRQTAEDHRRHFARHRRLQRRLSRYDRRHPRSAPGSRPRMTWKQALIVAAGVAVATRVAIILIG